jgi:hypothetical protein
MCNPMEDIVDIYKRFLKVKTAREEMEFLYQFFEKLRTTYFEISIRAEPVEWAGETRIVSSKTTDEILKTLKEEHEKPKLRIPSYRSDLQKAYILLQMINKWEGLIREGIGKLGVEEYISKIRDVLKEEKRFTSEELEIHADRKVTEEGTTYIIKETGIALWGFFYITQEYPLIGVLRDGTLHRFNYAEGTINIGPYALEVVGEPYFPVKFIGLQERDKLYMAYLRIPLDNVINSITIYFNTMEKTYKRFLEEIIETLGRKSV